MLDWLLQQPDPNQSCKQIFLAARCVGEVRNRGELVSAEDYVKQVTKDLIRFRLDTLSSSISISIEGSEHGFAPVVW
jgi:hypothetical protein